MVLPRDACFARQRAGAHEVPNAAVDAKEPEAAFDVERKPDEVRSITSGQGKTAMAVCEVCGNDYDKAFQVTMGGKSHTFDSFECAVHALAPKCAHCGCRIVGHGVEKNGRMFCCAHCAGHEDATELRDRA
jgi:hypothetical protein